MARDFVKFYPQFFVGETGVAIREAGGSLAQLIGVYLLGQADYLGLFQVRLPVVAADLGLELSQVNAAIEVFERVGFVKYDRATSYLWIVNGPRYQLDKGGVLEPVDTKVKMLRRAFGKVHKKCTLRREFHERYAADLHLEPLDPEVAQAPAVLVTPTPVATPVVAPVEAPAPIAALTPPPLPVVALVPVAADRVQAADGSFPRRSSSDDDTVDVGIEPSAEDLNRISRSDAMALSYYHDVKRMLMGLREQCRDQYPVSGDEAALALVERIRKKKGPYRAHACIRLAMTTDDLDMNDARLAEFGEELVTEDDDI